MDDLMDMLVGGESSPAEVSDKIKEILYAKSSSKIDAIRPDIGAALFGDDEVEDETDEVVDELEVESEEDEEEETQTGDEDVD
tara:strand:- start:44 stop:292 length:249 start_codon:yes stop_codon:yes gene_type:complete